MLVTLSVWGEIHAKNAQFIAVKRERLAVSEQIMLGEVKVTERGLGRREPQFH